MKKENVNEKEYNATRKQMKTDVLSLKKEYNLLKRSLSATPTEEEVEKVKLSKKKYEDAQEALMEFERAHKLSKITYDKSLVDNHVLLSVRHLKQFFNMGGGYKTKAVHDISFDVKEGECFGLVGSYKAHSFDCCHLSGKFVAFPCERGAVGVEITAHTGLAYGMLHEALQRGARLVLMSGFHEYYGR